jgi:hypothetical protein
MQLLYPDLGISEPLWAVAERYDLDLEALHAAAQSALAAPDRVVSSRSIRERRPEQAERRERRPSAPATLAHQTGSEPLLALLVQPDGRVPAHGVTMTVMDSRSPIAR